jgi:hypothetical protein
LVPDWTEISFVIARLKHIAPFLLLGPLTGPLVAGLLASVSAQRPFMVFIYALGLIEVALGLPAILTKELVFLTHLRA